MKNESRRRRSLLPLLLAAPLACSDVAVTAVDVARVEIDPAAPTVFAGQTVSLRATLRDDLGNTLSGRAVAWSSVDPGIVSVDDNGVVTGVAIGSTRVLATAGGQQGESTVTVLARPVASVDIVPAALQLIVGESASLTAHPLADDGEALSGRPVTWQSDDPSVAAVDATGVVTAAGPGTTRVRALSEGIAGEADVVVAPKPVASVQLAPTPLALLAGDTARLTAILRARDGSPLTGRTIAWRSESVTVARVDGAGLVTAVGAGSTRIIASAEGVDGAADVQVSLVPVAAVSVSPRTATLNVGDAQQFHATVTAADGTLLGGRPVIWSADAASVITIDATGRVTATGPGAATVTATVEGVSGTAGVTVQNEPVATVSVQPATVNLKPGDAATLTAETRAADGTVLTGRTVAWSSSDARVATVDAAGKVTAVAAGSATITAKSEGKSGTAAVTVANAVQPVAKVTVAPSTASLETGELQQFTATLTAADGTVLSGRPIAWKSSDVAILLVDAQGLGAGVAPGQVTVTATSEGVSGTAAVTVTAPPPPPVPVATVTVGPAGVHLKPGDTQQFTAEAKAADGTVITGRTVTWTSGNTAILTVNAQGVVTAVAQGKTKVSAKVDNVTGQVDVTVDPPPPAKAASVRVTPALSVVRSGTDVQLQVEVRAADGTLLNKPVKWTSSDGKIASVSPSGLVKTKRAGTVTIRAEVDGQSDSVLIVILP